MPLPSLELRLAVPLVSLLESRVGLRLFVSAILPATGIVVIDVAGSSATIDNFSAFFNIARATAIDIGNVTVAIVNHGGWLGLGLCDWHWYYRVA